MEASATSVRPGMGSGVGDFSTKRVTRFHSVTVSTPNSLRLDDRHLDHAHGDVGALLHVVGDHRTVVHLVDVIAGQHQHVLRPVRMHDVDVLVHRVGRAAIPVAAGLLLRGNHFDELAELAAHVAPAAMDVLDQRLRLVLREHGDLADAGVHAVRQHEIDDAELAAERRRGFGAMFGEALEAFAAAARHDDGERAAGEAADVATGSCACWAFGHWVLFFCSIGPVLP